MLKDIVVEGQLFYPWKGQIRFQARLVGEELILSEPDEQYNRRFEKPTAPTVRLYKEKDKELFKEMIWPIKHFIKGQEFVKSHPSPIDLPVKFSSGTRAFESGGHAQIYVHLLCVENK